jgi:hypothetical protein
MPKLAWRLFKSLLSLPLFGLVLLGIHLGLTRSLGDLWVAGFALLALIALWAELIGPKRLEPALPWLGLVAGLTLILGAPSMAASTRQCTGRRWLCDAEQLLLGIGGPWLAALPWALLGAITVFYSARALLKR